MPVPAGYTLDGPKLPPGYTLDTPATPATPAGVPAGVTLGQPAAHPAVTMQAPTTLSSPGQRLFGANPVSDLGTVVGSHLKNIVAGPYHALTDAPRNPQEAAEMGTTPDGGAIATGLGHIGLAGARMLVNPTADALKALPSSKNATDVMNHLTDAVPIAGPWARSIENDAAQHGAIPALAGLGTDIVAPKAAGSVVGGATNLGGKGIQALASTPEAVKVAATRALVTGSPGEMLNRSLKPPVSMPDFEQSVEASLPKIAAQNPKGVSGFADAAKKAKTAENQWYENLKAPYLNDPLDTTPAVAAQLRSIPATNVFENPGIVGNTALKASPYDMTPQTKTVASPIVDEFGKPITRTETTTPEKPSLGTIDNIRRDTNAKLKSFYNAEGGDRAAALSNPETARLKAVNDSTRDLVYKHLADNSNVSEPDIRENQNLFGHLTDVAGVAGKRATVAGRANPLSLQETLQLHGNPISQAYNFGTSRLFKNLTDSDAITNAAVDRFRNPGVISLPPRPTPFANGLSKLGTGVSAPVLKRLFLPAAIGAKGYQQ